MDNSLERIALKLNAMGFPNKVVGNSIQGELPLPYLKGFVKPSFKLYYSPKQKLIYFQTNRHSTEKLLRNLVPKLQELARETGLTFATRKGIKTS